MGATTDSDLEQAIDKTDLPALILEKFPDAITHRGAFVHGTRASLCAAWRSERSPSVSLTFKGGRWLYHDFGTHDGGNAFTFLTQVCGLTPAQAARAILERAGLASTARTGPRVAENERDRQLREFRREHPNADQDLFQDWLELRSTGWREIGAPIGRAALGFVATIPALPDLPGELIAHHRLGLDVPLERPPFGPGNLEALASWVAEALRPAFTALPTLATVAISELWQSGIATKETPWRTQSWNSGTLATRPRGW